MSLLFGPHTRLDNYEEEITKILLERNKSLSPVLLDKDFYISEQEKISLDDSIKYSTEDSELSILENGTIIPVDFMSLKTQEFYTKELLQELKNKFVSLPDFIFATQNTNSLDLIPVDIKNGSTPFVQRNNKINQISAYNLANLITLSPYLQKAIAKLSLENEIDDIKINNGFFILGKENTKKQKQNITNLEQEIRRTLRETKIYQTIMLKEEKNKLLKPKLIQGTSLFEATQEYTIEKINYTSFQNELGFIKNRITEKGYYGSKILAIGATKKGRITLQFEYHPEKLVKTHSPRTEKLSKRQKDFIKKEEMINSQIQTLNEKIERIRDSNPEQVHMEIYSQKEENIIEELYDEGISHLNERISRIEQEEKEITEKIKSFSGVRKNITDNEKELLDKEMRDLEERLNDSKKNYTKTKQEIEKEKEKIKVFYESVTNHKKYSPEFLKDVTKRYENLMDALEHHRPADEKDLNHLLLTFINLDNKIHRLKNVFKEYKDKISEYREKIYLDLKSNPWFSKKGLEIIENYKAQQIKEILKEKKDLIIAKDNILGILKADNENEMHYVDKKHELRLLRDIKNTKKIKEFHKTIKYDISNNSIAESPLTVYLNLNNNIVYKVQFYNSLNGKLANLPIIEETYDKKQSVL